MDDEREPLGEGDGGRGKVAVPASIWTRRGGKRVGGEPVGKEGRGDVGEMDASSKELPR